MYALTKKALSMHALLLGDWSTHARRGTGGAKRVHLFDLVQYTNYITTITDNETLSCPQVANLNIDIQLYHVIYYSCDIS